MDKELLSALHSRDIKFDLGLTEPELKKIKQEYNIEFPSELKEFYKTVLPISEGFYNWRDLGVENIRYMKDAIDRPTKGIYELAAEIDWCEDWGLEPNGIEKVNAIRTMLRKAPLLIPIFSHRYMPMLNSENVPILSIHGTDVIYYGENLSTYLKIEFGKTSHSDIAFHKIEHVPFWSDLL